MHSHIASEIWGELKRYLSTPDRAEAADALVAILINNDEDVNDIRSAFSGDADIKRVLVAYADDEEQDDQDDYEEDPDDWDR